MLHELATIKHSCRHSHLYAWRERDRSTCIAGIQGQGNGRSFPGYELMERNRPLLQVAWCHMWSPPPESHHLELNVPETCGNHITALRKPELSPSAAPTNNSFTGEIPPELGYLKRLQILRLHNNSISGVIPADLSTCSELVIFNLFNNRLVGKNSFTARNFSPAKTIWWGRIPDGLSQLADLTVVVVRGNSLTGTIPASLFNHSSLMAIDVGTNQIEGSLPPHLGNTLPSLQFLSIYRNQFTGSIPVSISNATNLACLISGRNGLTGKVPTLEKLQKLQRFTIAINSLGSGKADDLTFLSSLTNATDLDLLQVNQNKFGGVFPDSISNLSTKLLELSLSYNHISGNVPPGICNLANLEALYLAANLMGVGSFGSVYKGVFSDGIVVAVKVLNLLHRGASTSFLAEYMTLRNIRHRNLVKPSNVLLAIITISSGITAPRLNAAIGGRKSTKVHSPALCRLLRHNLSVSLCELKPMLSRSETPLSLSLGGYFFRGMGKVAATLLAVTEGGGRG
ncbi:hypothetical protein Acr_13g0005260 [Actinidia rufa]|uniref:Serine-threonine/tyrosine-protein kinase catalytic domain-containing protein n=1 Tax=Actinidia rufa TaxID=165716 RepID=A0A7J0FKA5_9ERIC|nr:hypothetical protein Acr_13g0005260 [Actinidia rufa]